MKTKPYFAKYVPVEEEIKEGNNIAWWIDDKHGEVVKATSNGGYPEKYKVTKLFLCSRDIQVGDAVFCTLQPERPFFMYEAQYAKEWCAKVIGEISPDALSFVKEGDEFDEDQIEKKYNVFSYSKPVSKPDMELIDMGEDIEGKVYNYKQLKCVQIKGPCGHFH
jgi:hypothetical protein